LLVGIGGNEAGINGKTLTTDQALIHASAHDGLKDMPQDVALPEPAIAVQ